MIVFQCELTFREVNENPIEYDTDPRSIALGDFNRDGLMDIVVANFGTNNIEILFGFGNGSFYDRRQIPLVHGRYC